MEGEFRMYDLLERAVKFAEKKGALQAEAIGTQSDALVMELEGGEVKGIERKVDSGIGVRVIVKKFRGRFVGSAFTSKLTLSSVEEAAAEALRSSRSRKLDLPNPTFPYVRAAQTVEGIYDPTVHLVSPEQLSEIGGLMVESAGVDGRVKSVNGGVALISYRVYLANSLGVQAGYPSTIYSVSVDVTARDGGVASGFEDHVSRAFDEEKALQTARSASLTALSQLKPKEGSAGIVDVVLAPDALSDLLAHTLCQEVRSDLVQKNQSPLKGKLGQEVSSSLVTIVDDGKLRGGVGSKPYDDEGFPTGSTAVIERGVLKSYIYNAFSALKEDRASTGNALRPSSELVQKYLAEPQVAPTNLILKPGRESFESLVGDVKEGVYVKNVIGAHTSNPVTGEFSVAASIAYKIEGGEVKFPVKNLMLGGNVLELLRKIDGLGKFQKQCQGVSIDSSILAPPIRARGLAVSA